MATCQTYALSNSFSNLWLILNFWQTLRGLFSAVSTPPIARIGAFRFFGFRDFEKEVARKYLQKRMGLALTRCLKIGGASKRGSQENGGGGKKVLTKRR